MKKLIALTAVPAIAVAGTAMADSYSNTIDVEWDTSDTGEMVNHVFNLPAVASIDSVELELAQTWGGDFEITLTSPVGDVFELMFDEVDMGGSGNFDMGVIAADGSLANVAAYTFVEVGGLAEYDDTSGVAPAGTYDARTWIGGAFAAGDWTLSVGDDATGDAGAVGHLMVNYSVPAPGALALLGLAGIVRRRRR